MIGRPLTNAEWAWIIHVGRTFWPDVLFPDRACTREPRCEPAVPCIHPLGDDE